jgi:short-subunit dehydrogenase involved in D-alanine esterification of teichoic acids
MLSTVIDGLKTFIDSIGGAKGALLILGTLMTKIFSNDIAKGINNIISNVRILTGAAQQEIADVRKEAKDIAMSMTKDSGSAHVDAMRQSLKTTYTLQEELRQSAKFMSEEQLTVAENAMKTAQSYNEIAISAGKAADEAHRIYNEQLKITNKTSGQFAADKLE